MTNIPPENITHYHCFDTRFRPLSYTELNLVAIKKDRTLDLSFRSLITNNPLEDLSNSEYTQIDIPITFNKEIYIFSLVDGGWLPLVFVNPPHFLIDSNVIINLERIIKNPSTSNSEDFFWWLQSLNSSDVVINPILYAFEGKERSIPKFSDFVECFEDSMKTIGDVLPHAKIIKFTSEMYAQTFRVVKDSTVNIIKNIEFLRRINSLIHNHVSKQDLSKIELEIINIAKDLKIKLNSLSVLAVLSCLYEKNDDSCFPAARKILKPSAIFNETIAYNALCDLRAIEFYIGTGAVSKETALKFSFCTFDKALALFACGLNLKNKSFDANGLTSTIFVSEELFPMLTDSERQEMLIRLTTD